MKKYSVNIASGVVALGLLSGCTSLFPDHGLDYQQSEASDIELKLPQGSLPARDKLTIPNEQRIADLEASGKFEAPRAPLLFEPLAYAPLNVDGSNAEVVMRLSVTSSSISVSFVLANLAK